MENNEMKKSGIIYHFDGEAGTLISQDYLLYNFSKKDIINKIEIGALVSFIPNTVFFGNEKILVAREVEKNKNKTLIK